MSRTLCVALAIVAVAVTAIIAVCVTGNYWRDVRMAGLGYEQDTVPGYQWPVWRRAGTVRP